MSERFETSHFLDGQPVPDGYFDILNSYINGSDAVTEQDEVDGMYFDPVLKQYRPIPLEQDGD